MICNVMRSTVFSVVSVILILFFSSCKNDSIDAEEASKKADSISIKLNSPELKAVNVELLADPNNAMLYDKRAKVYQTLKEFPEAVNDSKRAIKLDSTNAAFYLTLADTYFSQNNTRLSKELLEITAKKFPENIETLLKLAELYFLVKKYQEGIDFANKALKINENLAKAYFIKGSIYRESGDTSRAISSLETAVEQDNRYVEAFYDLGVLYAARKNPIALDYYNTALSIDPSNFEAAYAKAKLLQDLGKITEAISVYEAIIKTTKTCSNCYYNLGAIYLEITKEPKKALEQFTKAIETDPTYGAAYFARGYTYSLLKDKASAKADYNMCLQLEPNNELVIQELNKL